MSKPIINEDVLAGIPDELIRPLLAMCIQSFRPHTLDSYQQLLKDSKKLGRLCDEVGGQSLFYIQLFDMINRRIAVMLDAQKWFEPLNPRAQAIALEINRWVVTLKVGEVNKDLLIAYKKAGFNTRSLEEKVRVIVTEVETDDV